MAAFNFTMPLVWLYAVAIWVRAFLVRDRLFGGFFLAILTLPGWFIFTAIVTFINFPLGRINSDF
ncbi:hypothetical protein SH528x_000638 [Novipirellula sp. SH528]|uniref:hypothetical protein n=1 Tax=Novipirellula sp. SH528 TaxID=3454466 RepID=UPI003FA04435